MRLRLEELPGHLRGTLAPCYVVSGDEPLQLGEAADAIRAAARAAGHGTRQIFEAGAQFDWGSLAAEANAMSLFAEQKVIDLRIPSGKPGKEGGAALAEYAAAPPPDTLLLLTMPKLDKQQQGTKWFKAMERLGVVIQVWPVRIDELPRWVTQRMRAAGLEPTTDVAQLLADRAEGNLLAAHQEIEKLLLLNGPGPVDQAQFAAVVSDTARFDVFLLVDSALSGDAARSLRILAGLRAEGLAPAVVLWALAREVRALAGMAATAKRTNNIGQAMAAARPKIFANRQPLVRAALQRFGPNAWTSLLARCQHIDMTIKSSHGQDAWRQFEILLLNMAGHRLPGARLTAG
jgi:DNA polymerase-3 subunit delta